MYSINMNLRKFCAIFVLADRLIEWHQYWYVLSIKPFKLWSLLNIIEIVLYFIVFKSIVLLLPLFVDVQIENWAFLLKEIECSALYFTVNQNRNEREEEDKEW